MTTDFKAHPDISKLIKRGMFNLDAITHVVGTCPSCGNELRNYNEPEGEPQRCGPFCMLCGHKEMKKREEIKVQEKYDEALRDQAIGFMKKNSIFTDDSIWKKTFKEYKEVDAETKMAKAKAEAFVNDLMVSENGAHVVFTGNTGVGKTHLSMAMIYRYLKLTGYKKTCMIVSYRELLEQLKFAMNDEEARKKITGEVMREIKRADLVLIDDIGAQLGDPNKPSKPTSYDIDTMNSLFEARLEKATIVTMNLGSTLVKQLYGDRVYSRIVNNVGGRFVKFEHATDKRITGI